MTTTTKPKTTYEKINLITKDLFPSVKLDDTLHWENKRLHLRGQQVTQETLKSLVSQAKTIQSLDLYQILLDEMVYIGQKKIFDDTQTLEDMKIARMILWTIDVLRAKVDKIAKM